MSTHPVPELCDRLRVLQAERAKTIKMRIAFDNNLRATVASTLGYTTALSESDRTAMFEKAGAVIRAVVSGEGAHPLAAQIGIVSEASAKLDHAIAGYEKRMVAIAKSLPVAAWVESAGQRGFGLKSLATVVGEAGDLSNYANPGKLWKRFGLAPWSFGGRMQMGSTWKAKGGLPAEEWTNFGYSPRRRSIAYIIGENIVKQNKGEYRARYDATKVRLAELHPDYKPIRCHRHGMLLATKLLLRELWITWNHARRDDCRPEAATDPVAPGV